MKTRGVSQRPSPALSSKLAGNPAAISRVAPAIEQPSFKMIRDPNEKPASVKGNSG